jgi:hypothetical protein
MKHMHDPDSLPVPVTKDLKRMLLRWLAKCKFGLLIGAINYFNVKLHDFHNLYYERVCSQEMYTKIFKEKVACKLQFPLKYFRNKHMYLYLYIQKSFVCR